MKKLKARLDIVVIAGAFIVSVGACVYANTAAPMRNKPVQKITLLGINITATENWGGAIVIFNEKLPYFKNITYAPQKGEQTQIKTFGACGIYFYGLESNVAPMWWTFVFSIWYPLVASGAFLIFTLLKQRRRRQLVMNADAR